MAVKQVDDTTFKTEIENNPTVVVKYYADWCGSCKLIAPKYRRISESENHQNIVFLDVNAEQSPEARKMAGVDNLPFFAAFKNGELVEGSAASKEEYILNLIEKTNA